MSDAKTDTLDAPESATILVYTRIRIHADRAVAAVTNKRNDDKIHTDLYDITDKMTYFDSIFSDIVFAIHQELLNV